MLVITKDNIVPYLKQHIPEFDDTIPVHITMVGEGREEEDGDGYVNYIFRVQTDKEQYVLKQALDVGRMTGNPISVDRIGIEYDSLSIRYAIVPEYTPALKFYDEENQLFVMEDVSPLNVVRFQMNQGVMFPALGRQCGECMAKTEFYTSEFYLDRKMYRKLQLRFENTDLRRIMEDGMFLDRFDMGTDYSLGPEFAEFAERLGDDSRFVTELYKLRRSFISHADALIHADFHTSNILASLDKMKLIDTEFSFMGPFGYDLGYLTGNLISQYCAACFKPYKTEKDRTEYKAYLLATIKTLFQTYFQTFVECWNRDAKLRYQGQRDFLKSIFNEIMTDAPGIASMVNWFRVSGNIAYPDFDCIKDPELKKRAMILSLLIDWQLMYDRYQYNDVDDLIQDIVFVEQAYCKK